MNHKCLYCYQVILEKGTDFHEKCAKKFFGIAVPPIISFGKEELNLLAQNLVSRSEVITGVQPKLSLSLEKIDSQNHRLTVVGVLGKYILKPQTSEFEQVPENEDLVMKMAEAMGIQTAEHTLIKLKNGEFAYLTKRFDRKDTAKIHQLD